MQGRVRFKIPSRRKLFWVDGGTDHSRDHHETEMVGRGQEERRVGRKSPASNIHLRRPEKGWKREMDLLSNEEEESKGEKESTDRSTDKLCKHGGRLSGLEHEVQMVHK